MKLIAAALVKAQKGYGPALKSSTNPHFRSKYADLSACIEAVIDSLNDNGIALMQVTHEHEQGIVIETLFIHESGEQMSAGRLFMPATKLDAQGFGSALSYARRYSLMASCGIAPEDDDANQAVQPPPAPKPVAKAVVAPVPVAKPVVVAAPVVETPQAPPKMQGSAGQWQLKVAAAPDGDMASWLQVVSDATTFALEMAQTKDDVLTIFRTNLPIFNRIKADDQAAYDVLMATFKTHKEKLDEQVSE